MPERFLRWKIPVIIVLVVVLVGTIHSTSVPRPKLSFLEAAWRDVLSPFQLAFTRVERFFQHQVERFQTSRELKKQNAELTELVANLEAEVLALQNYRRENEWLRDALDFKDELEYDLVVAEVIGRSPSNWESTITLNKGKAQGVEKGMAVITKAGIVGTVIDSSRYTSTVLLAIDRQSATGGLVQASGDLVLLEGGEHQKGNFIAKPLSRDTTVEVGDVIVTSGLSQIYPKNLPIGEVTAVEPKQYDLSFNAVVRPFVDFTRLEYVLVAIPGLQGVVE